MSMNVCKILSRHPRAPFPVTLTFAIPSTVHKTARPHIRTFIANALVSVGYIFRANTKFYYNIPPRTGELLSPHRKGRGNDKVWVPIGREKIKNENKNNVGTRTYIDGKIIIFTLCFSVESLWCVHTHSTTTTRCVFNSILRHTGVWIDGRATKQDISEACSPNLMVP